MRYIKFLGSKKHTLILPFMVVFGFVILGQYSFSTGPSLTIDTSSIDTSGKVRVEIKIYDPSGLHLAELTKDHMDVFIDDQKQVIANISQQDRALDLSVAVAIDTSGSMRRRLRSAKETSITFLDKLPEKTRFAIYSFNDKPQTDFVFSTDITGAKKAIQNLHYGGRFTALYDTIFQALEDLDREDNTRKILVVITDGKDENSKRSLENCLTLAVQKKFPIFAIAMGTNVFEEPLKKLTLGSSGQFFSQTLNLRKELDGIFKVIVTQFKKTDGLFRIDIEEPLISKKRDTYTLRVMIHKDSFNVEKKTALAGTVKSRPGQRTGEAVVSGGEQVTSKRLPLGLVFLALIVVLVMIVVGLLLKKRSVVRLCPNCGLEIPKYLEECLHCSDVVEEEEVKKSPEKTDVVMKALIDTEPAMADLEKRLEKTLILVDIPMLSQMSGAKAIKNYDVSTINELIAGRNESCDIVLFDKSVSSQHAKIVKKGENYYIKDLGSTNGTFVNEKRLMHEEIKLSFGDAIRLGQSRFLFKLDQRSPA